MISQVAPASCSAPRPYVARYLKNWVSCAFYNYDGGIAETSRDIKMLFNFNFY